MRLSSFEGAFDPAVLERGRAYHRGGHVLRVEYAGGGLYSADVEGSRLYEVTAGIEGDEVFRLACDCPYADSARCKHMAAVLFALRERDRSGDKGGGGGLEEKLAALSRTELAALLEELARRDRGVRDYLRSALAGREEETEIFRNLIRSSLSRSLDHGTVPYAETREAMDGARRALERLDTIDAGKELTHALEFALMVAKEGAEALRCCDDSDGEVSAVIAQAVEYAREKAGAGLGNLKPDEVRRLFGLILRLAGEEGFAGYDWQEDLEAICADIADRLPEYRQEMLAYYRLSVEKSDSEYWKEQAELACFRALERWEGAIAAAAYRLEHLENDKLLDTLLDELMENQEFRKCADLCLAAEKRAVNKGRPGTAARLRKRRYAICAARGDRDGMRALGRELLLDGDGAYYDRLRELYSPQEWEPLRETLLDALEKGGHMGCYAKIILQEKRKERILGYLRRYPGKIIQYHADVLPEYAEEAREIFETYLEEEARRASDRSAYRAVCGALKRYRDAFGRDAAAKILTRWREGYRGRRAFMEEMDAVEPRGERG